MHAIILVIHFQNVVNGFKKSETGNDLLNIGHGKKKLVSWNRHPYFVLHPNWHDTLPYQIPIGSFSNENVTRMHFSRMRTASFCGSGGMVQGV